MRKSRYITLFCPYYPPPLLLNNCTASELTPSESILTSDDEEIKVHHIVLSLLPPPLPLNNCTASELTPSESILTSDDEEIKVNHSVLLSPCNTLRRGYGTTSMIPFSTCILSHFDLVNMRLNCHVHLRQTWQTHSERMNHTDNGGQHGQRSRSQLTHIEITLWTWHQSSLFWSSLAQVLLMMYMYTSSYHSALERSFAFGGASEAKRSIRSIGITLSVHLSCFAFVGATFVPRNTGL